MATPIRPSTPLPLPARPAAPGGANEAARAAQRAFFSQALNAAQAPVAQPPAPQASAPAAPALRQAAPEIVGKVNIPQEPPQRPLRPGSLLDIKV